MRRSFFFVYRLVSWQGTVLALDQWLELFNITDTYHNQKLKTAF
jgi:hypothetical protein